VSNFSLINNIYPLADTLQMRLGLSVPKRGQPKIVNLGDPTHTVRVAPWLLVPTKLAIKASHVSKNAAAILFQVRDKVYALLIFEKAAKDGNLTLSLIDRSKVTLSDTTIAALDGRDLGALEMAIDTGVVATFTKAQRDEVWKRFD
jgi:hypothetical protein